MLVQFLLFIVCGSSLLIKYFVFEKPRRPCCVWFWDVSKQGWGAALAHTYNLIFSSILVNATTGGDTCAWYFINISIDTFIGVIGIFVLIDYVERFANTRNVESLARSGDYGTPPRWDWWLKQFLVYLAIVTFVKIITFLGVFLLRNQLNTFGLWIMSPLLGHPFTELILVMILIPALMNAWVFWVTDTFIMLMAKNEERYPTWCCCLCRRIGMLKNQNAQHRGSRVSSGGSAYGALNGGLSRESSFSGSLLTADYEPPLNDRSGVETL